MVIALFNHLKSCDAWDDDVIKAFKSLKRVVMLMWTLSGNKAHVIFEIGSVVFRALIERVVKVFNDIGAK
ncbi:hypothetical protein CY1_00032 [Escherichia phage CY1_Cui-2023]|nr:hypothetical protein CY1_00032 [Escherichia phage CY1_Cui-2023]